MEGRDDSRNKKGAIERVASGPQEGEAHSQCLWLFTHFLHYIQDAQSKEVSGREKSPFF